jgi:hypothetical protein
VRPDPAELVFIGGTGRSGTTVLAELLGHHSRFCAVPIECRFHCHPAGLADVVARRASPEAFVRKLRTYWWYRVRVGRRAIVPSGVAGRLRLAGLRARRRLGIGPRVTPRVRGLHQIIDRGRFDAAVARFEESHRDDVLRASRHLFYDILAPVQEGSGKRALVEMSTYSIAAAPELARIFPEARFVHSVRDGRDSGASKVGLREKAHHPTEPISGIDFWAERLRLADLGAKGLSSDDRSRFCVIGLDELVWADRDRTYAELLEFLGTDDEQPMRDFFELRMTAQAANVGRWHEGLDEPEQREVNAHYEATLSRLEREEYHCAALLRRTYERTLASKPRA